MFSYLMEKFGLGMKGFFTPPTKPAEPTAQLFADPAAQIWKRPEPNGFLDLLPEQCEYIAAHASCPYCHGALYDGPRGGASINVFCENVDTCNSRFNVCQGLPWGQFTGPCPQEFIDAMHSRQESA
jgi:hypothetical protein